MKNIVLLAECHDLPALTEILISQNREVVVKGVSVLPELEAATRDPTPELRLVCFCTGVIVPAAVLHRLSGPSYNFHPGPPEYRGIYPAVFAINDEARQFGATAHELSGTVDDGIIVGVDRIDMPENIDRLNLEALSRQLVTRLFVRLAPQLIGSEAPLSAIGEKWSGQIWSRRDFGDLCLLGEDATAEEFGRRYRAVGEGPEHALGFERFGRRFSLVPAPGDGLVYKGGKAVSEV